MVRASSKIAIEDKSRPAQAELRAPTDRQRQFIDEAGKRVSARRLAAAVRVGNKNDKICKIGNSHSDHVGWTAQLMDAFGTASQQLAEVELSRLSNACGVGPNTDPPTAEAIINAALGMVDSIRPENEVEAALGAQMAATHAMAMDMMGRVNRAQTLRHAEIYGSLATRMQRTYIGQCEALAKMRRGGEQKVRVEHVHIHSGAQAVVGDVVMGGGGRRENGNQPHALVHAPGATLWSQDKERASVPATGHVQG